jgi:hypothetical protein
MNLVVIVLAQVNKSTAQNQRDNNKPLTEGDMAYTNTNDANLSIGLTIHHAEIYDGNGNVILNMNGEPQYGKWIIPGTTHQAGIAYVVKNSISKTGVIHLHADFEHLTWRDEVWIPKTKDGLAIGNV